MRLRRRGGRRRRQVDPARPRRSGGARRFIWPVLASVLLVGVLFVAVFPTQTYLSQRADAAEKTDTLREIEARNAALEEQIERLSDPGQLELEAREQLGLVFPGEESYAIVQPPNDPVDIPSAWPFNQIEERVEDPEAAE